MEGALIEIAQATNLILALEGNAARFLHRDANPAAGIELRIKFGWIAADRREQEAVYPPEIAGYAFVSLDLFDAVNRGRLAFVIALRKLHTPELNEGIEGIVRNRNKMRGRSRGHALADGSAVENDDVLAPLGQLIGGR